MLSEKYGRTYHLPFSPGRGKEDKVLPTVKHLLDRPVIATEKGDGSNVCVRRVAVYARSHSGAPRHPSFDALKAFHASVAWMIPEELQIFGEWCWAKHSIHYTKLPSYLLLFGIRNLEQDWWLSWEEVEYWAEKLGVATVPFLLETNFATADHLQKTVERLAASPSLLGSEEPGEQKEGVVLRIKENFWGHQFSTSIAKYVRANHIQTNEHWSNLAIVRNHLRGEK